MRALVLTPNTDFGLALRDAPDPKPTSHQALVEVAHASLNFSEVRHGKAAADSLNTSDIVINGLDAAGVVVKAAEDGSGPAAGTRVLTFGYGGAWAQYRAVSTSDITVVPDTVELAVAAGLPATGVTALRTLRRAGTLLGRRVLITGASGGVGRFAIQLAALAGAQVVAVASRTTGLAELGAQEVKSNLDAIDLVDVAIETVGGAYVRRAWELLATNGTLFSLGTTVDETAEFPAGALVGQDKSLISLSTGGNTAADMKTLVNLVATEKLTVDTGWRGSWRQYDEAAAALLNRQVRGKAILDLD